jgi:hypothetical protein
MGNPGDPGERDLTYDDLTSEEKDLYNEPCGGGCGKIPPDCTCNSRS